MMYIEDRDEKQLLKAASLADTYSLIHKTSNSKRTEQFVKPFPVKTPENPNDTANVPSGTLYCKYCKKEGHTIKNCKEPNCKASGLSRNFSRPSFKPNHSDRNKPVVNVSVEKPADLFDDFKLDGTVSLTPEGKKHKVRILRDTGAAQSLLLGSALPNIYDNLTEDSVLLKDLSQTTSVPLANICLDCPLKQGSVLIGVRDTEFPVQGVTLLLGNDLAGNLVVPNLVVTKQPISKDLNHDSEEDERNLVPSCAVTRSQKSPVDDCNDTNKNNDLLDKVMSREELINAQGQDVSLSKLHIQAVPKNEIDKSPCYYYESGLLMRFYRPPKLSNLDTWGEKCQIVLPLSVRNSVLEVAHDGFGGHLGVHKTYQKILNHFFWPGMKKDVADFIRTCHICQISGKPNQVIPRAPLQPIVVPHEPFHKIIIDCVGPLPRTKKGHQYLLTILCPTTRYPIAIPLRNISAKAIVKTLLKIFTTFGIPKEIQSDRGSNFTSDLFAKILKELGIKQTLSSAYHPESQGALERWHQTFKSMLKKYCLESESEWDEGVDFLLFAIREAPQETLGFSPFEMLFGRTIRGPLSVIKDEWLNTPSSKTQTIQQFINELKNTLQKVRKIATENLKEVQLEMKTDYDKMTKVRKFKPGDLVLAYFPVHGSPLKAKFCGPYKIVRNVNNNTYIIKTPDRRKSTQIIHVNLLKEYHSRSGNGSRDSVVNLNVERENMCNAADDVIPSWKPGSNSKILENLTLIFRHLLPEQSNTLQDLLLRYNVLFHDFPRKSNVLLHDIELLPDTTPIRQPAYRTSPERRRIMKEEVDYLLRHGLAIPSKSPWASPCLLVAKEDGSSRFCTDYRKVNKVTIKDSYPLPRIDDLIDSVGQARFVSKIDLLKGYYQVGLTERAKLISAFITPFGLFQYEVMAFGLTNAPSTFQRIINYTIQDLEGVYCYLDDILVTGQTWQEHLSRLETLFQRLREAGLTINLKKTTFCEATVSYLGHIVGDGNVRPKVANIEAIIQYPVPTTRKSLMRFLGMASYYRRFCKNFSSVASPLTALTSSKVKFLWTDECNVSFEQLKSLLCSNPVLQSPDFSRPFVLQVDACDTGAGGVLLQESVDDGFLHPVCYTSSKFKSHQMSYSTIEKECLSLVLALQKFECYLQSAAEITTYTDHNPITFLETMKSHNQRLLRWALYLQKFPLKILHIKGSSNIIADALSRVYTSTSSSSSHSAGLDL